MILGGKLLAISGLGKFVEPEGRQTYDTPGTFNFVVPNGVTNLSVLVIGAGGGGGGGVVETSSTSGGGGGGWSWPCVQ